MIIDGKAISNKLISNLEKEVATLPSKPGLAVVLVGEDPASKVYVSNKIKKTEKIGMNSFGHFMPESTTEEDLLAKVDELNKDDSVHGILVQLPLPKHIKEEAIIDRVSPEKDVDGFHVVNSGKLFCGLTNTALVPCTPSGCVILAKEALGDNLSGNHVVVIGRSNIVGKPAAQLFLQENCTVTIAHSRTRNLEEICKQADILVPAIGRANFIGIEHVKQGATIIDVGINRNEEGKLCGDVNFEEVKDIASHISPVPGGVGPMTIACLLKNTVRAYRNINNV